MLIKGLVFEGLAGQFLHPLVINSGRSLRIVKSIQNIEWSNLEFCHFLFQSRSSVMRWETIFMLKNVRTTPHEFTRLHIDYDLSPISRMSQSENQAHGHKQKGTISKKLSVFILIVLHKESSCRHGMSSPLEKSTLYTVRCLVSEDRRVGYIGQ